MRKLECVRVTSIKKRCRKNKREKQVVRQAGGCRETNSQTRAEISQQTEKSTQTRGSEETNRMRTSKQASIVVSSRRDRRRGDCNGEQECRQTSKNHSSTPK